MRTMALHSRITLILRVSLLLLGVAAVVDGSATHDVNDDPSTSPTVTVTDPVTVTSLHLGPTTVTVTRTRTRPMWTSEVVVTETLNCIRTIFTGSRAGATPPLARPTSMDSGLEVAIHQESESSASITTPLSYLPTPNTTSAAPPTVTAPTATTRQRPTRTRTIVVVSTAVQTAPHSRTAYECAFTVAYLLTTTTTTVPYTRTRYPSTVTATSTINCPYGMGGLGWFDSSPTPPPDAALPTSSSEAARTPNLPNFRNRLYTNSSTSLTTPALSESVRVSTVRLTRTAYTVVTVNATAAATVRRYECSTLTYDATVTFDVTRTAWPSTTTIVSLVPCRRPGRPPGTSTRPTVTPSLPSTLSAGEVVGRQTTCTGSTSDVAVTSATSEPGTEPTSSSDTVHRTTYFFGTVTVTATVPATRIAYSCAPVTTATVSVPP